MITQINYTPSQLILAGDVICSQWQPTLANTSSIIFCNFFWLMDEDPRHSSAGWWASVTSSMTHHDDALQLATMKRWRTNNVFRKPMLRSVFIQVSPQLSYIHTSSLRQILTDFQNVFTSSISDKRAKPPHPENDLNIVSFKIC